MTTQGPAARTLHSVHLFSKEERPGTRFQRDLISYGGLGGWLLQGRPDYDRPGKDGSLSRAQGLRSCPVNSYIDYTDPGRTGLFEGQLL